MNGQLTTMHKINQLINEYRFHQSVLEDIHYRLQCCQDEYYVQLQLRYLQNLIKYKAVERKE
ncbi:hypothetical protein ETI05_03600 [Macrococcoides canis]|uniref:DUF6877 family protein n=1 Tax=Macrococcoides canis TaxID=1855823 RepID=UPI00105ED921|nr:hypothetical protein ETI05_03600 [Macrococcus canis]